MTGSGKSTLLAIILGDHPRSFTEDVSLFGNPRDKQATATRECVAFKHTVVLRGRSVC